MIDGTSQIRDIGNGVLAYVPDTAEGQAAAKELRLNRIVRHRITTIGSLKQRSVEQLNTYFACCKLLSDNSDDPNFATKETTDEWVRLELRWIDHWIVRGKQVNIKTKSISFANLKHLEACKYFDRAFELIAKTMGITVETLIAEAKARMKKRLL